MEIKQKNGLYTYKDDKSKSHDDPYTKGQYYRKAKWFKFKDVKLDNPELLFRQFEYALEYSKRILEKEEEVIRIQVDFGLEGIDFISNKMTARVRFTCVKPSFHQPHKQPNSGS